MAGKKVLVVGLDGATLDLVLPWIGQGHLPVLARLIRDGSYGPLQSTLQPVTASAWATFMTGVNQGKHGLYDFVRRRTDSYKLEVTNGSMIAAPTIFDIVGQSGGRVIAVNVPYTFPPPSVNGILVSGLFAPAVDERIVFPSSLAAKLFGQLDGYFVTPDYDPQAADPLSKYIDDLKKGIDYRRRLSLYLMNNEEWDLFVVVFMATDLVQHSFWRYMESGDNLYQGAILEIYQHIDQALGDLLESIDDDTVVMIMSDHGAGPLHRMVNLNRWLADAGYLSFYEPRKRPIDRARVRLVKSLASAYRQSVPAGLRSSIRKRLGAKRFDQLKGELESTLFSSAVEWSRTIAYALGSGGNVYLNLAGREPAGVVSPGHEYERIRAEVAEALSDIRDPESGQPIVRRVWRREEIYSGIYLDRAPDLIIEWSDYRYWGRGRYDILSAPVFEEMETLDFTALPLTGTHRPQGMLVVWGGGESSRPLDDKRIADLAPTILDLLGLPIPGYMDGHALWDASGPGLINDVLPVDSESGIVDRQGDPYSSSQEQKIVKRLKDLGYL
jgi:predicted AlkP superfamily phosphohydrolase/phosphomutase